jgi:hypothetical protein
VIIACLLFYPVSDDGLGVGGLSIEPSLAVTVGASITGGLNYGMDPPSEPLKKLAILKAGMTVHDAGVLVTGGLTVADAKIVTDGRGVQEGGAGFCG